MMQVQFVVSLSKLQWNKTLSLVRMKVRFSIIQAYIKGWLVGRYT